jgi:hypothetical protein
MSMTGEPAKAVFGALSRHAGDEDSTVADGAGLALAAEGPALGAAGLAASAALSSFSASR